MSEILPLLGKIYSRKCAVMPKSTDSGLVNTLRDDGWSIEYDRDSGIGSVRRQAVRLGLRLKADHLHFCESDRLIVWAKRYPDELVKVVSKISNYDFLVIGRTNRAFQTHPRAQRDTEASVNAVCSLLLGKNLDVTCASRGLSKSAARFIGVHSKTKAYETDVEWPCLMSAQSRFRTGYVAVEGLEYEDWLKEPDRVNRLGDGKWFRAKETDQREWALRIRWAMRLMKYTLQLHGQDIASQEHQPTF
jgi:hypothetical protein